MRNFIPQQQQFDHFSDLIEAAKTQYTLSFKDACKMLKCSRSWANTYIRPHVPNIYLTNGKGTGKANYARIVSLAVNKEKNNEEFFYSNESVYLDEAAFNKLIFDSITTCQKRSKKVYRTYFIKTDCIIRYYKELLHLCLTLENSRLSPKKTEELIKEIQTLYLKYAKNDFVKDIIHNAIVYQTKRTDAEFVNVSVPDVPIVEWKAVHDLMDYGDIEESIYRDLFKEGCIRIEIKLPDKHGEVKSTGKIYYIEDPETIKQPYFAEEAKQKIICNYSDKEKAEKMLSSLINHDRINIKQSAWLEYNRLLGNQIKY